ncbi:hypothetical protein BC833DRAFT_526733 [Globomyces pollinis-pini]|nr:hypothetical protein BC833DRAFT_526733 [Globomyces pollinis-pini]
MPSNTLETEIVIDCPPELVKSIFMDWSKYPDWNPFITSMSSLKGDFNNPTTSYAQLKVIINIEKQSPMTFTPQVLINSPTEFRWVGTVVAKWLLAGEHWFQFLPLENGTKTRFVQGECFTGVGVGLFKLMTSVENTKKGFISMNEALKKLAESKVAEKPV